ncbi:MFS transporter [Shimwellia pseudoproteus]|uniref:MFS transporter n=1 Tax=Shimwellia pseudoproteus TaxID=570012 RepID=UPI0018EC9C41|nr:MFS transporter [Shimwellia pseudoproteus]
MAQLSRHTFQSIIDSRFSGYQCLVIGLCFLVALFDGFDTQAVAFTGPAIIDAFRADVAQLAPVMTAGIAGMTVGAMVMGMLGDRLGRRNTLLLCVAIFACATLLTAFAPGLGTLFTLRVIAGFGMGGATPVLLALAAEYAPHKYRGLVTTGVLLALPAGAMSGGLLAAWVLPMWGWQSIYLIGGLCPLVLLVVMVFALPDSLEYLSTRPGAKNQARMARILRYIAPGQTVTPRATAAGQVPVTAVKSRLGDLFTPALKRTTFGVWSVYFFNWVAWFMLLSWLPTLLKQSGLNPADAPLASVTVNAAFILFALPLSWFLPRVNTLTILGIMFATGVVVAAGLSITVSGQQWWLVFTLVALAGFGIGGQQLALNYLVVATYPARVRATAMGWAIGIGRLGAIFGSAIGGVILSQFGAAGFFALLVVPLLLSSLSVLLIRKRYRREAAVTVAGH